MILCLALVALCALLAAGCGSGDGVDPEATAPPQAHATPERTQDEQAAAEMATRYLKAVTERDWEAACETRSARERKEFARMAGSSERLYEVIFKNKPVDLFEGAEPKEVRIERDIAGVDMHMPGQDKPATTVAVVRTDGGWYLEDLPEAKVP